jgi:hypothetical protein
LEKQKITTFVRFCDYHLSISLQGHSFLILLYLNGYV